MTKETILQEIQKLPLPEQLFVLEQALKEIRLEREQGMEAAVVQLYDDYKTDESLTAFTALDGESFYETR